MPSIKTTTDISWEPDPEKDDRLFVSYQHTDKVIVNDIINRLERKGFLLWWDKQIYAGEEWEEDIKDALNRSSSFLGFISNGISESKWSIFEIREAIKNRKRKREQGINYTIVLVFVEKVPMSSFPKDIREEVEKSQYISFWEHNGITEDFLRSLLGAKWNPSVIKEERRKEIKNFAKGHKLGTLADFFSGVDVEPRSYHRLSLHANKATKDDVHPAFYRLEPNDLTSRETVYPVILDNQWLPPEFYDKNNPKYSSVDKQIRDAFAEKGLSSEDNEKLKSEIDNMQRREFIRALLHNWQLVVNRAAIFNTTALRKWYTPGSDDYTAFGQLIGDDSIVIYLYSENYPTEEPPFDYDKENYEAWKNFCFDRPDKKEVSCVRFDWEKQGNDSEKARLLSGRVENFFLTLAHDKNLKNELMRIFGITEEEQDSFELCLRTIQQDIINQSLTDGNAYKREHFYDTFLIEKKELPSGRISQVNDGILRKNKKDGEYCRFVPVMKQLMDHIYIVNLPDALGIQPYFPPDSGLNPFLLDQHQSEMRMLTVNQLIYAVVDFDDSLKQDSGSILDYKMPWPVNGEKLTLAQTAKLRQSSEWRAYLVALTDGKHRNRLNEVDFYNIHT
ncbi:MAG: toll/interleukin-1 receptor domain-containing protein, partial [Clostridia bacterium]|nr:toll/interleukin-1 receptor domain-containing protein [Clostridia bacterium]